MPKCAHCDKAIRACITRPRLDTTPCPPQCNGYYHHGSKAHRCQAQAPTTYAQAKGRGDG